MGSYILRRLLLFIPNLILVSLLVFTLSELIPGSPVQNRMPEADNFQQSQRIGAFSYEKEYARQAKILGLDKPLFYFTIGTSGLPDTLYRIFPESRRRVMVELASSLGSWPLSSELHLRIRKMIWQLSPDVEDGNQEALLLEKELRFLLQETEIKRFEDRLGAIHDIGEQTNSMQVEIRELEALWSKKANYYGKRSWIWPYIKWNGFDNRYHNWIGRILTGDMGKSIKDGQPVFSPIMKALRWTLLLNVTALMGVLLIAIPLGVYTAVNKGSGFDRWTHRLVYLFYSIPGFWLASLGITFLTSATYGKFWHWFPSAGITNYRPDMSFWANLEFIYPDLIMPVLILILPSLAFLFRQVRTSMLEEFDKSYAIAAKARGISGNTLIWKTVFPNASFPVLTMIGGAVPGLIAGSLIMEVIFSIPGMGRLMYEAMLSQDWNILYGVIIIGTLLVMISYLMTDLVYAILNPKVKLS